MIRYIYTFFVGLFLAIFVGMGVGFFYESPKPPEEPSWFGSTYSGKFEPSDAQRKEEEEYSKKIREFEKTTMSDYNRNVSIIVLSCAVIILVIALLFDMQLGIIADGLLLGGIFTLLYGIARGISVDSNSYRFIVASIGLAITLALGYRKFVPARLKVKK